MKALTWHGKGDIRCEQVDDPAIEDDRDIIIKVTSCAICGSDLHLMNGYMPTMESGDVLVVAERLSFCRARVSFLPAWRSRPSARRGL